MSHFSKFDCIKSIMDASNDLSSFRPGKSLVINLAYVNNLIKAIPLVALTARDESFNPNWGHNRALPPVLAVVRDSYTLESGIVKEVAYRKFKAIGRDMDRIQSAADEFVKALSILRESLLLSDDDVLKLLPADIAEDFLSQLKHSLDVFLMFMQAISTVYAGMSNEGVNVQELSATDFFNSDADVKGSLPWISSVLKFSTSCFARLVKTYSPDKALTKKVFKPIVGYHSSKYAYVKSSVSTIVTATRSISEDNPFPAILSKKYIEAILANGHMPGVYHV